MKVILCLLMMHLLFAVFAAVNTHRAATGHPTHKQIWLPATKAFLEIMMSVGLSERSILTRGLVSHKINEQSSISNGIQAATTPMRCQQAIHQHYICVLSLFAHHPSKKACLVLPLGHSDAQ